MIPRAITTVNVQQTQREQEIFALEGELSGGAKFFYNPNTHLYKVMDQGHRYGMGRTMEEAIRGMQNNVRVGFTPFHEWVGDELVKI